MTPSEAADRLSGLACDAPADRNQLLGDLSKLARDIRASGEFRAPDRRDLIFRNAELRAEVERLMAEKTELHEDITLYREWMARDAKAIGDLRDEVIRMRFERGDFKAEAVAARLIADAGTVLVASSGSSLRDVLAGMPSGATITIRFGGVTGPDGDDRR